MLEVNQLPLNSFFMAARVSLDSSCDERGVNALCQLPLSSSRKFEDGEDLLFESSIMRSPTTTSEAKTINAIASPFMPPFPLPLPWAELDLPRGAGPDDHAFPPVLQKIKSRSQKQYLTTYILKKKKKRGKFRVFLLQIINAIQRIRDPTSELIVFNIPASGTVDSCCEFFTFH